MTSILDMLRAANPLDAVAVAATASDPAAAAPQPPATAPAPSSSNLPQAPARPCYCGFRTFWLDPYGVLSCHTCKPPKFAFQVKQTFTVEGEENNYSWSTFSAYQEKLISELEELQTPCGRKIIAHSGWDDPRSEYFNQRICAYMEHGVAEADRISAECSDYLIGVLHDTGTIDRLPGPWPANKAGYSLAAEAEKPKRKPSARSRKK